VSRKQPHFYLFICFILEKSNTYSWSSLMASTTIISCTTVLRPGNLVDDIQSHTFLNIPVNDELLGRRGGVLSIMIGSLLSLL
jgi:hypothetical protein